jgi:hypothetical protein
MRARPLRLGILLVALLARCGQEGATCPAGSLLVVVPQSKPVKAGDPPVQFLGSLAGCTEVVVWTLNGPGTLDLSAGTTIHYTPPGAVPGVTSATLMATAGGLVATATITVSP